MAKSYRKLQDFAFFFVNFGTTKKEYEQLTQAEIAFIIKAYENKVVQESTLTANAVFNAISNAFRKKGKKFHPLWKKKAKKIEKIDGKNTIEQIRKQEETSSKDWVRKIYEANGLEYKG